MDRPTCKIRNVQVSEVAQDPKYFKILQILENASMAMQKQHIPSSPEQPEVKIEMMRKRDEQEPMVEEKKIGDKRELESEEEDEDPKRMRGKFACCNFPQEFYRYGAKNRTCQSGSGCIIAPGVPMMINKKTIFCMTCWDDENNTITQEVCRTLFSKVPNLNEEFEEAVECSNCHEDYHDICENFLEEVVEFEEFVCRKCGGAPLLTTLDHVKRSVWDLEMEKECNAILGGIEGGDPESESYKI